MKFKKDLEPIFYPDIGDILEINAEDVLTDSHDVSVVSEALEIVRRFINEAEKLDIINFI